MINKDTHTGPSFSLSNRMARVIWNLIALFLFRFSPKPFHPWRSFLLRCFGAKVGKGVHVYPGVRIWAPWNLDLGDGCGIGSGAILYSQGKITIGRRAVISQGVNLCAGTHDYTRVGSPLITRPIYIGDSAWIAAEAFVHPGVHIGNGCVIGARAVVVSNMPEWMVCAGHPCKPIKARVMVD
ncbi:acetyltransferase [Mucilaginibacter sp. PAMC 26640]|nr:acetyltransferase [Mucilaginibacter sp. PAMC 26640]